MFKKSVIALLLIMGAPTLGLGTDTLTFPSTYSEGIALSAKLRKPEGDGPFPAVVMLHGCSGPGKYQDPWEKRLINWGYVTLRVDSFGPRGVSNICASLGTVGTYTRAWDAHDGKSYLAELPFVDSRRIAVIGWSHGGVTTLMALNEVSGGKGKEPFRAGIAFYPYCGVSLDYMNAPLLILIGGSDDWASAKYCIDRVKNKENREPEIALKVYSGAYHGFDIEGLDSIIEGHRLLYDSVATADAITQVKDFLAKHVE